MKIPRCNVISATVLLIMLYAITGTNPAAAKGRTSLTMMGGMGLPVGWWGERWEPIESAELNLRIEMKPGAGFMIFTGLNKTYFKPLSKSQIAEESRYHDVYPKFEEYKTIISAYQGGSFKLLPIGFGFYFERMVASLRVYGSAAMTVYNWKFERTQQFHAEITPPGMPTVPQRDDWTTIQDGSDLGAQAALGAAYRIGRSLYLDLSAAYHFVNISSKLGSIAYWGYPARIPPGEPENDLVKNAKGAVDFIQFRLGLRIII